MVVYKDIISGDIILNDTFTLEEDGPTLITCTCRELPRTLNNADDIVENGACNNGPPIYDIEETFNLVRHKPEKADFKAQLNIYLKAVARQIAEDGASRITLREFQAGQRAAINRIMDDWENLEVFMTPSMDVDGMYVLIGYRENGRPYAMYWKHGLEKVEG